MVQQISKSVRTELVEVQSRNLAYEAVAKIRINH